MADEAPARREAAARAHAYAPFLRQLIDRRPKLADAFINGGYVHGLPLVAPIPSAESANFGDALRLSRADHALVLALADLAGEQDLWATVAALSVFADHACEAALRAAFKDRTGESATPGFAVIALGKQGSSELNYSSDIDPILIFDPAILPRRERDDPTEAATRLARRWVELLAARTGAGYVLRVDLRLRPSPEVTPIALPVDAAISYYESQALAWEQAAFIRARCVAGDQALGARFLHAINPFIWRSVRDYGQLERIADMSARIRDHYDRGQQLGPGFDLKRGRGGIREVEFFTQSQQLIHGGRNPDLRSPQLRDALPALVNAGLVDGDAAQAMIDHYALLRTIEHRLQMTGDQQTHSLPVAAEALDAVARLHGLTDGGALLAQLSPVIGEVAKHFDTLLSGMRPAQGLPSHDDALAAALSEAGFADPAVAARVISDWRSGQVRVLRTAASREALERVLPELIGALGRAPSPDGALLRLDAMVGGLPSVVNLFHLLHAQPRLLAVLVAILSFAPTLAAELGRRAELLEGLIDASALSGVPTRIEIESRLNRTPLGESFEALLDRVRREVGELRFALGAQIVEAASDPMDIARGYAEVAECALATLTSATIAEFERVHGRIADGELLILALGRLGGEALTHASDLDLILLFTGDHLAESDGARPLGATTYFNRLGQRVIAALSVATAAGPLYEVDTRLRPQGNQGPLVAALDAFARYQREEAWTWEHMALTRARPVFGSAAGRAALAAIIAETLIMARDPVKIRTDVAAMRADVRAHKTVASDLDVKMIAGGLVDLEFAVHFQQLVTGIALYPQLGVAIEALIDADAAPPGIAAAYAVLGRMLVALRLMSADMAVEDRAIQERVAVACGEPDWAALMTAYADARAVISQWMTALRLDVKEEDDDHASRFNRR